MFKLFLVIAVQLLLLTMPACLNAQSSAKARELVEKAIQAHGGRAALEKLLTASWKGRGLLYRDGNEEKPLPFYGDWHAEKFDKYRYSYAFKGAGGNLPVTSGFLDGKGWRTMRVNRGADDLPERLAQAMKEEAHAWYVSRLVPLLQSDYQLTTLPVTQRDNRQILGLKVDRKQFKSMYLFFDKQKGYLTYIDRKVADMENQQEALVETSYLNFRKMGEATLAQSITMRQGKKMLLEIEMEKVEPKTFFPPKFFEKPPEPKDD
ncbi:MAG: hypothetical protein JNJ77_20365 [Planctomycetia bacterium]|nr:hypothetical protein [Planctomycetia bacterium]